MFLLASAKFFFVDSLIATLLRSHANKFDGHVSLGSGLSVIEATKRQLKTSKYVSVAATGKRKISLNTKNHVSRGTEFQEGFIITVSLQFYFLALGASESRM